MVSVVAAYLRTHNVRLAVYIDDWLIVNQSKRSRKMPEPFGFTRFHDQQREILSRSQTKYCVSGCFVSIQTKIVFLSQDRLINLMQTTKMLMQVRE